jgi:hypothetical protein
MSDDPVQDKPIESWPGQNAYRDAIRTGNLRKCSLCGALILGGALACVRPSCPMQPRDSEP